MLPEFTALLLSWIRLALFRIRNSPEGLTFTKSVTVMLFVEVTSSLAFGMMLKLWAKASKLLPEMTGLFVVFGMMTQCVASGTPFGVQFKPTFQAVFTEPFHTFPNEVISIQLLKAEQATPFNVEVALTWK